MSQRGTACSCRWDEDVDPPKRLSVCRWHETQEDELERLRARVAELERLLVPLPPGWDRDEMSGHNA